jgi:CheY-like chemotaxis protein
VLLADDHRQLLESVSASLSDDFDVAGLALNGTQAIEMARALEPDLIVLDVDMPGLDGFQTLQQLQQAGSPPPVVFLSMHDTEEIVSEAFRRGGRGYVVKTRVRRDLPVALESALAGRLFVPSLGALLRLSGGSAHAMQIYRGEAPLLDDLAAFFDLALRRGDATCVITSAPIREQLADRLRARGWDVGGSSGHKRYLALDSGDALSRLMRDGTPDPDRIADIARELDQYRQTVCDGSASRLTLFGDIVMRLSAQGNTRAMIALEHTWTELTRDLPILTLCGYHAACFHGGVPHLLADACAEHGVLSHARDV